MIDTLILLAGGLATRLRPITETVPKSLIEINGKPFIDYQINLLKNKGIKKVIVCAGFLGEQIKNYLKDGSRYGLEIDYSFDGDELIGTGGAVKKAIDKTNGVFWVMYGDSYLDTDFEQISRYYESKKNLGLMTVFNNSDKWDSSNVEFENGRIIKYDKINKTKDMQYIDYGLSIFHKEAFSKFRELQKFDLTKVYSELLNEDELLGFEVKKRFYEVGSFKGIEEFKSYLG
jgi:NDP-sugar pyrophosphorylase family protein